MEEYRNILANKFMRDTNYIIIKDTDDLEELERQWELFQSSLTVRQQRLSDDRSIQIWNMTNQQHYEELKYKLMGELQNKLGIEDDEPASIEYEPENDEEQIDDDEITNFVNMSFDDFEIPDDEKEINESIEEGESIIPIDGQKFDSTSKIDISISDYEKDKIADQYEIDSNINIIGSIHGNTPEKLLANLDKAYADWNAQNQDHRKKSDDKCREIYGMSNIDRYNKLKGEITKLLKPKESKDVKSNNSTSSNSINTNVESLGEFVTAVYNNMQIINEAESNANKQHRRLNDTPYFTPSEMIDMGVHGNHNYYCKDADNDGLITNIRVPTWFASYKDMCMDHIFEDYTKDWIDTLDTLYSDFEEIKESGDTDKILARKQSILDLGWNPEIPFTRRNRQLASKRVSKLLDKSSPMNIFINLDKEVPDNEIINDEPVVEAVTKETHKPVFVVFVQGKTPIISSTIKKVTHSPFSHSGISFNSYLDTVHSYNMHPNPGIVKETLAGYKDNVISVMAFFAPNKVYDDMKEYVMDFWINSKNTVYDFGILFNKLINKNVRTVNDKYHQVCSTFVDAVLKSGNANIDTNSDIPSPAELYNSAKSDPNKIIEVYSGPANEYDGNKVKKKMNKLLMKNKIKSIEEAVQDAKAHESNDIFHNIDMWESGKSNILFVTGLSGSGKSTLSKELSGIYTTEYVELDNIQRAKMSNWDTTNSKILDSYIHSVGGLENIFPYCNTLEQITWKDIISDENGCHKEHDRLIKYIINYANTHKRERIIVEGVQIFYYCNKSNETLNLISKYPVIIKTNGPLKTEFRREKRAISNGIEKGDSFIQIFKRVSNHVINWIKNSLYMDDYNNLKQFKTAIGESYFVNESVLNEVKQFPVEFDKEGNLIIYKVRVGSLSFGDEIADSVKLLESYRNTNNIEGIKYELAKLWFINDSIEKKLKKRLTNDEYKELIDHRATCLNVFKLNLEYVMTAEKGFNFSDYYNSTPFSDNSIKITANTLKYSMKAMTNMV